MTLLGILREIGISRFFRILAQSVEKIMDVRSQVHVALKQVMHEVTNIMNCDQYNCSSFVAHLSCRQNTIVGPSKTAKPGLYDLNFEPLLSYVLT